MEFSKKGHMDPMNGHFSRINGLQSVNGIQFSLCGTLTNLIFANRDAFDNKISLFKLCIQHAPMLLTVLPTGS